MSALRKQFSFDVNLQQAYKSPEGKMHVVGVASDDLEDRTGDRMSDKAIGKMVAQAKKNALPLLDNHRSTFGFGRTFDASARKVAKDGKTVTQFMVDFELDERYPQAQDLYSEVESGKAQKQLSIGGFLPLDNPKAVAFEQKGTKVTRRIDDILLEHIATTRPGMAAVPRTKFVSAVIKDIFEDESDLPDAWHQSVGEQIERQVDQGATEGVANTPEGPVDFELVNKEDTGGVRTIVVMVNMPTKSNPHETVNKSTATLEGSELEANSQTETEVTAESATASEESTTMSGTTTKSNTSPAATNDEGKNADSAIRGLQVLSKIGKAFDDPEATAAPAAPAAPAEQGEQANKDEPTAQPVQEEVAGLAKAITKLDGLELNEKSAAEVRRLIRGMAKLLDTEVGDERLTTDSSFSLKSMDELAAKIEKAITEKLGKQFAEALEKSAVPQGEQKTASDVIEVFQKSFEGLTTEIAKGLVDMATGFKAELEKNTSGLQAQLEQLEKASDERIARLEKAAGVRQSMPSQDGAVATGAVATPPAPTAGAPVAKSVRSPDEANPFRGAFDAARGAYMSQHR